MARCEAVFLDLYETLITEFDPDWQPRPTVADQLGVSAQAFDAEWWARRDARMTGTGAHVDYRDVLRAICGALDHSADDVVLEQLQAERLADKALPFARIEDDVLHMVQNLHRAGVKVGLISNCAPEEVASWATSPLAAYFDDAVLSYQVGYAKPDARIYRLACERLAVAPQRSIFVGDGGSDELTGAKSAGLTPFQATWFLDRWPAWRRATPVYEAAADYPQLHDPAELVAVVVALSLDRRVGDKTQP